MVQYFSGAFCSWWCFPGISTQRYFMRLPWCFRGGIRAFTVRCFHACAHSAFIFNHGGFHETEVYVLLYHRASGVFMVLERVLCFPYDAFMGFRSACS